LAFFDGLPEDALMSFLLTILDDDAPTFDSSFCALLSTSTKMGSFEVLANCRIAMLLPKIVARLP
jgi:hypothetical protein